MQQWQNKRRLLIAGFCIHFGLIVLVCVRDTASLVARGYTCLPHAWEKPAASVEQGLRAGLGENFARLNPLRQVLTVYLHVGGIESGYGYFAPNVPDNYKLVFEVRYPDGRIEYDLPQVSSRGAGLRLATLLDNLGQTRYEPLRELIIQMLAYGAWQQHPGANHIRAVLGFVMLPDPRQFKAGVQASSEFLYAYEFSFGSSPSAGEEPF